MRNKLKMCSILFAMIILVGCNTVKENNQDKVTIEFYNATPIESFSDEYIVEDKPFFSENDIEYYDWENQIIKFKTTSEVICEAFDSFDNNNLTLSSFATKSMDKYYVYVDHKLIYSGFYRQAVISSFFPIGNTLTDIDNGVKFAYTALDDTDVKDNRFDDRVYKALEANGLLMDQK